MSTTNLIISTNNEDVDSWLMMSHCLTILPMHHQKNRDTSLTHHENFCRPTYLGLPHQDSSSYHQFLSATLTMTSPPTK